MANRFDIHIQTLPSADQEATGKFMSFGFESTVGVKGFQSLINMWLKCFLTPRGSDPTDLTYGTDFSSLIGSNVPLADAQDVVQLALNQCNSKIVDFQSSVLDLTASERLAVAKLINFEEDPSGPGFNVSIEIQHQARERLLMSLPTITTS